MSVAAAALALSRDIEFDGHTYPVRPLTYEDLARFSLWLEDRAAAAMYRAAAGGYGDAKALEAAHLLNVAAGEFEPGGPTFDRATKSPAGNRVILSLMLDLPAKEREPLSWRIFADEAAFAAAMKVCAALNADPDAKKKRRTPAPPATPSP